MITKKPARGRQSTYRCEECSKAFTARVADRDRGWARFCSKSCTMKNKNRLIQQAKANA